jgi:hypothetical protein
VLHWLRAPQLDRREIAGIAALAAVIIDELELRHSPRSGNLVYRDGTGCCSRAVAAKLYAGAASSWILFSEACERLPLLNCTI